MIHAISKDGLGLIVICEGERIEGIVTDGVRPTAAVALERGAQA